MTEGFEYDTFNTLRARGYPLERLDSDALRARFPAWHCGTYKEGYVNPQAGWVESGRVVAQVAKWCREAGVRFTMERVVRILDGQGRVQGVTTETGATLRARRVVVAAGAWNCDLVPQTREIMHPTAQVVLHFRVPAHLVPLFTPPLFPGYAADIGRTGFYGFPVHPERLPGGDGVLKVGCHAEGVKFFGVSDEKIAELLDRLWQPALERARRFLRDSLPSVADAPLIFKRVCLYTDTYDTDFLIDAVPSCAGLFIAGGGSGHAFKFAPMLGRVIADLACGEANEFLTRFRWRSPQSVHVERDRGDAARISTFKDAAIAARL
jgi:glycine/D-amino acid oxidase-like deaminating enzyme